MSCLATCPTGSHDPACPHAPPCVACIATVRMQECAAGAHEPESLRAFVVTDGVPAFVCRHCRAVYVPR